MFQSHQSISLFSPPPGLFLPYSSFFCLLRLFCFVDQPFIFYSSPPLFISLFIFHSLFLSPPDVLLRLSKLSFFFPPLSFSPSPIFLFSHPSVFLDVFTCYLLQICFFLFSFCPRINSPGISHVQPLHHSSSLLSSLLSICCFSSLPLNVAFHYLDAFLFSFSLFDSFSQSVHPLQSCTF